MEEVSDQRSFNNSIYPVMSSGSSANSGNSSDRISQDSDNDDNGSYADQVSALTQAELSSQISNISTLSQDRRNRIERSVTHYENMDKGITRMPQFYKADEFLKCLSQFTMENETLKDLGQFKNTTDSSGKNVRYEIIIENQRGATVFGAKMFCKQSVLYPLDPPKYQTLTGQNLVNISMYPEPANNWNWSWKKWHVMMINDVDEEGWIYSSIRFGSYKWTGVGRFGNFVRRRIWVRMVERSNPECISDIESVNGDESEKGDEKLHKVINVHPTFKDAFEQGTDAIERFSDKVKNNLLSDMGTNDKNGSKNHVRYTPDTTTKKSFTDKLKKSYSKDTSRKSSTSISTTNQDSESDSDETPSIVSFSRDTMGESNLSRQDTAFYPRNPTILCVNEVSEDEKILQDTLDQVDECSIDRQRITLLLNSIFSYEDTTIDYLLQNYKSGNDKTKTWIHKFISKLHFHDSEIIFVHKFKILLDTTDESTQQKERHKKLYLIFEDKVNNRSYDSEK